MKLYISRQNSAFSAHFEYKLKPGKELKVPYSIIVGQIDSVTDGAEAYKFFR